MLAIDMDNVWQSTCDFFELGTFLKRNDPLKILRKQVEYAKYWYKINQYE